MRRQAPARHVGRRGRADRQQMSALAAAFHRGAVSGQPATIREAPVPQLSANWYCALASVLAPDEHENWRDPIICTVAHRQPQWPPHDELTVSDGTTTATRLLTIGSISPSGGNFRYRGVFDAA